MMRSIHNHEYRLLLGFMQQVREALGVTQSMLAQRLRTTQSYVSKCERGERRIDVIEYVRYCDALGVDAGVLMDVFLDCRLDGAGDRASILDTLLRKSRRRLRARALSDVSAQATES
ncbi:helix-turn-helix transcriptional regulator [Dyella ginsengisoli]|uniref:Helix-turn-helix transcriptional regulator n=1 Tax=Dyella ginsengisoli TaxID=363848 RepID=A0ABW8JXT1_9GAMM